MTTLEYTVLYSFLVFSILDQSFKKDTREPKGSDNRQQATQQQNDILTFSKKTWNKNKTFPSSAPLRIMNKINLVAIAGKLFAGKSDQDSSNRALNSVDHETQSKGSDRQNDGPQIKVNNESSHELLNDSEERKNENENENHTEANRGGLSSSVDSENERQKVASEGDLPSSGKSDSKGASDDFPPNSEELPTENVKSDINDKTGERLVREITTHDKEQKTEQNKIPLNQLNTKINALRLNNVKKSWWL